MVIKVIELIGESPNSWEEATKDALAVAAKTIRGIVGIDVDHFTAKVQDNEINNNAKTASDVAASRRDSLGFFMLIP